jgi:exopolysaccharide biosynthesis polyprenyl glycosylphosphotransferase
MRTLVLVLDGLLIVLSMVVVYLLHPVLRDVFPVLKQPPHFGEYALVVYLTVPLWLLLLAVFGMHRIFERVWKRRELLVGLIKVHLVGLLLFSSVVFLTQTVLNRSLLGMFLGGTFLCLYLERVVVQLWLRFRHEQGYGRLRLLLVGDESPEMEGFISSVLERPFPPLLVGRVGSREDDAADSSASWLGEMDGFGRILEQEPVDRVLFFPPRHRPEETRDALELCETLGVPALFYLDLAKTSQSIPRFGSFCDQPFATFELAPRSPEALVLKRVMDFVVALVGLILLSPILLLVSLVVLATMGRPVIFSQKRSGLYGRPFRLFKFRTMVRDAEAIKDSVGPANEMGGPVFKASRDPRITRTGRFLRRWSLDELPQLVHVLGGTMSLVGPRPLPVEEQQQIRGGQRRRLSMRPGMTGLWQVSGRSNLDFEEWMRLDLQYVDSWSLGLDFRILFKTVWAVLSGKGAK